MAPFLYFSVEEKTERKGVCEHGIAAVREKRKADTAGRKKAGHRQKIDNKGQKQYSGHASGKQSFNGIFFQTADDEASGNDDEHEKYGGDQKSKSELAATEDKGAFRSRNNLSDKVIGCLMRSQEYRVFQDGNQLFCLKK